MRQKTRAKSESQAYDVLETDLLSCVTLQTTPAISLAELYRTFIR